MSRARARALAAAVLALAATEIGAAGLAYRERLDPEAWAHAREALEAVPADEPVLLANDWLGPSARMELPRLREPDAIAPADLHGLPRFAVLGLDDAWSDALDDALEGLPRPRELERSEVGPLTLHRYENPGARVVEGDLLALPLAIRGRGPCRGGHGRWRCEEGTVELRWVEVDYRPRRCLALDVRDHATITIRAEAMTLGRSLRGHVGFSDFNARLRNDSPIAVRIAIDDVTVLEIPVTDAEGWRAFEIPTEPGLHAVEIEVRVGITGTWNAAGLRSQPRRIPCLELRALDGAEP